MASKSLLEGLRHAARALEREHRRFAVVGGLAVAVRAEPRFTRDVDLAIAARDDADVESLVFSLRAGGYQVVALVEHESQHRLATARLVGPSGLVVDLVVATCGIEAEVVDRSTGVTLPEVGPIGVARAEELLAMKVLSMTEQRAQDRLDAISLLLVDDAIDLAVVRDNLRLITERGFHREQDLLAKLESIVRAARAV